MDNKLQELTDKLYREGLSKGKEEGEAILAKAELKATEIVEAAQKKAEEIIKKAEKDSKAKRTPGRSNERFPEILNVEVIADDELVEVTPKSIRMRKKILTKEQRMKLAARGIEV